MKLRKAIIGIISVVLLIGLSLVMSISHSLATARPVQDKPIAQAAVGEIVLKYVGKIQSTGVVGYFTYIAGYDGPYFSDPTIHNETTAHFTLRVSQGGARSTKLFRAGNLGSYESEPGGGITTVYFNPVPHGNYAMPDTFSDGTMIGQAQFQPAQAIFEYQPESNSVQLTMVHGTFLQAFSESFTLGGNTYTWGAVGKRTARFVMMAPNPTDPTVTDLIGNTTALPPAQ
jgi:hypothetical protein